MSGGTANGRAAACNKWVSMRVAAMAEIENAGDENRPQPVPTGFFDLDEKLEGGLPRGELVILGARPSVGKTALALCTGANVVRSGGSVVFYSLETQIASLARRWLSAEAGVTSAKIFKGDFDDSQKQSMLAIADKFDNFFIDGRSDLTVNRLKSEILGCGMALDLIIIDYTQLMQTTSARDRYLEVGSVSLELKRLGQETGIAILALAQLNRQPEGRANKKPELADLRESGSLEQDAHIVLLMHKMSDSIITLDIAKNKDGPTGEIPLVYEPTFTRFRNADIASVTKLKAAADPGTARKIRRILE